MAAEPGTGERSDGGYQPLTSTARMWHQGGLPGAERAEYTPPMPLILILDAHSGELGRLFRLKPATRSD